MQVCAHTIRTIGQIVWYDCAGFSPPELRRINTPTICCSTQREGSIYVLVCVEQGRYRGVQARSSYDDASEVTHPATRQDRPLLKARSNVLAHNGTAAVHRFPLHVITTLKRECIFQKEARDILEVRERLSVRMIEHRM